MQTLLESYPIEGPPSPGLLCVHDIRAVAVPAMTLSDLDPGIGKFSIASRDFASVAVRNSMRPSGLTWPQAMVRCERRAKPASTLNGVCFTC